MIARLLLVLFAIGTPLLAADPIPTRVTVHAVSRDAKVIGTGVGGARITIRDKASGRLLAEGVQSGGTGETKLIMTEPRARGQQLYTTDGTAAFVATLALTKPIVVDIAAEGPLKYPQAMQRTSKTILLVPGEHIEGDGVVLEIHGFIVDFVDLPASVAGGTLPVRVKMGMT